MAVPKQNKFIELQPAVPFLSQRDNINPFTGKPDGHNQCMVASFTMCMNWLGLYFKNKFLMQYSEHLHLTLVGKNIQEIESRRYNSVNHADACNKLLREVFDFNNISFQKKDCSFDEMVELYQKKKSPIIVGTLITDAGHIVVYHGNKYHDPYGIYDPITKRYSFRTPRDGENVEYSAEVSREILFRNQKRRCWYIEGLV